MYSIVLANGKIMQSDATKVEWDFTSHTIQLIKDNIVVAEFNMDNVAGVMDHHTLFQKGEETQPDIKDMLSSLDHSMECTLESDHRSFTNRVTENSWLFDMIIIWRKMIKPYIKED